ncbi:MAG TPA: class I tRNA ligase family protein, partial [Pseudoxanthomonas sp.]|nr:class I tRNA ligase family protein [Pseudoxanthomonas sp.]
AVKFVPGNWINTYRHWMENIQDWCISRQLWWGHRIPAWWDDANNVYVGRDEAEVRAKHALGAGTALTQDSDVLETWFSSALWPFSTQGWPDEDAMRERGFDRYLPSSVLVTGFDIIFFWVARMIMLSDHFTGRVPFEEVYVTGLIRDKDGQKMSKSKGNVLDPLDIIDGIALDDLVAKRTTGLMKPTDAPKIEKATRGEFPDGIPAHGADALRFTIAALANHGRDIKFDMGRAEGYKNFCNKLWNATRFVLMNTEGAAFEGQPPAATDFEKSILAALARTADAAHAHFAAYRFDLLAQTLYEFAWNQFCDWFVELAKPALGGQDQAAAQSTRHTLLYVLESLLRLLHPLIPFITEALWRQVAPRAGVQGLSISLQPYPDLFDAQYLSDDYARFEADVEWFKALVASLRGVRSGLGVAPGRTVPLLACEGSERERELVQRYGGQLSFLLRLESIRWLDAADHAPASATAIHGELKLLVPLEGLVDLGAERARLDKELKRVEAEIAKCGGKLASETFVDNAPPAVVEQERKRLAEWNAQLEGLKAQRAKL